MNEKSKPEIIDDVDKIQAEVARRERIESKIREILTHYYRGNETRISDWYFRSFGKKAFGGQIPSVALLRQPDAVYKYVKKKMKNRVDPVELNRPSIGEPITDLPPTPGESY